MGGRPGGRHGGGQPAARPDAAAADPENHLLSRQQRIRLDAEILRDSALIAGGLLNPAVGGPSVHPPIPPGANNVTQVKREWVVSTGPDRYRRGMYTFFQRSAAYPALLLFDAPDATVACTRRIRSNTPLQALISMNDETAVEFAGALGHRIQTSSTDDRERIRRAWLLALCREPRLEETERMMRFVRSRRDSNEGEDAVWLAASRVLLNLDEFVTRQ